MRFLVFLLCLLSIQAAMSADRVRVLALFPGKAMLDIDGQRKVLSDGEVGPGGVELLRATPARAVIRNAGREQTLTLGSAVSSRYREPERAELRVLRDNSGSYFTSGLINGHAVRFLIDTGATQVAMGEAQARRLGIDYRVSGTRVAVGTASGDARAWLVTLDTLKLARMPKQLRQVTAYVVEGDTAPRVLLGMNVLQGFDIDQRDNLLILRARR